VGCHHGIIARNYLHDLSANAVQAKGGSEDIEIRHNHMVNAGERTVNMGGSTGFQFFRPSLSANGANVEARDIRVVSNLIQGAVASLAFVGCVQCAAVNNTIIDPENWIFRILQETTSQDGFTFEPCRDNLVANNLIYFSHGGLSATINIGPDTAADTFTFSNNLWYAHDDPSRSAPSGLPVTETAAVIGQDPGLSAEYHIGIASPAAGAGAAIDLLSGDYAGICYASPPSIGAFEAR